MTDSDSINPYLTQERESEIDDFAEWLVDDRFAAGKQIEPIEIARSEGLDVISGHYEDKFDGLLEHDNGRFFIYCNLDRVESLNSTRARFTLAHELGHYYIDDHRIHVGFLLSGVGRKMIASYMKKPFRSNVLRNSLAFYSRVMNPLFD